MPVTHPLAPFRRGVSRVLRRRPRLTDAIDWMYRLPVITITRRHPPYTSRVALTSYRKKIPRIACRTCTVHVRALGKRAIFRHAHGHAYAAGGRPCEHKHLSSAQALQASSPSLRSWGLRKLRSGHPSPKPREPSPAAGRRATRRPTPSDSTLGSSTQSTVLTTNAIPKPHPPKAEAPPYETYSPKGGTMGVVWKAAQRATVATSAERGTFHG